MPSSCARMKIYTYICIYIYSLYSSGILKVDRCYVPPWIEGARPDHRALWLVKMVSTNVLWNLNKTSCRPREFTFTVLFILDWKKRKKQEWLIFLYDWEINHWNIGEKNLFVHIHIFFFPLGIFWKSEQKRYEFFAGKSIFCWKKKCLEVKTILDISLNLLTILALYYFLRSLLLRMRKKKKRN